MTTEDISRLGLIGCGGAGFPTHVKLAGKGVKTVIVNAAECEPLLDKDKEILWHFTADFFAGLVKALDITGAQQGLIAIKEKYSKLIAHVQGLIPDGRIKIMPLGDFYPAGDEFELVYEATGTPIPFGGIPLNVGCVVDNVETLLNLGRGRPVITKLLTVTGAVPHPITVEVPVGAPVPEVLALAGLSSLDGLRVIDGGPMMGKLLPDASNAIVSKTTGGLLVLPNEHILIQRLTSPEKRNARIARAACDQCTDCSELCPRALLGYPVRPHKAMRTAQFSPYEASDYAIDAVFCSECGLCSKFSCPEGLTPTEMSARAKRFHLSKGVKLSDFKGTPIPHPMRSVRRVSIERLVKRLALLDYIDNYACFERVNYSCSRVVLPLKMNIGAPAQAVVRVGELVEAGQLIAQIPQGKLGAMLHASLSGRVEEVSDTHIVIAKK